MKTPEHLWTLFMVGVTVVLWASAFVGIRAALVGYSPTHLALLRFLVASLLLLIFALVTRTPLPARRDLLGIALTGFVGITIYNLALNTGEVTVSAGAASLLVNTSPIWTALLATLLLHERLRVWGWAGIAVSFCGAALIAFGESQGFILGWGAALVLAAALAQSIYFVAQKPFLPRYTPLQFTSYAIWAGTICLLPFAGGLWQTVQSAPLDATLAVIYLGVGPGALAYAAWAYALTHLPASRAASALYLVSPVALALAWLWLGEVPGMMMLVGGFLALSGVVLVNTKGKSEG